MKIAVITLFPQLFEPIFSHSILGRAHQKGLVQFNVVDLRQFGEGKHKTVDDRPYGGGAGMILRADILAQAIKKVKQDHPGKVILTSASGKSFTQNKAQELSLSDLIIICGHYEGVDQRFIDKYVDEEISIGDYVLTGGELPAMVIADTVTRLVPQVLKKEEATVEESFTQNLLEYPHYTRPKIFEDIKVPEVLLTGNHQQIKEWRKQQSLEKTKAVRPDLLK